MHETVKSKNDDEWYDKPLRVSLSGEWGWKLDLDKDRLG